MKTLFMLLAIISITALSSCQREDLPDINTVRDRIIGKWKVDRLYIDYYDPIPVLDDSVRYVGIPSDSIVFKADGKLFNYMDDPSDPDELEWQLLNDSTISVDGELMQIKELTLTRFWLQSDERDDTFNERTVFNLWLYR